MPKIKIDGISYVNAEIESCLLNIALNCATTERTAWASLLALRHMRGQSRVFCHSDYFRPLEGDPWVYAAQCFAIAEYLIDRNSEGILRG